MRFGCAVASRSSSGDPTNRRVEFLLAYFEVHIFLVFLLTRWCKSTLETHMVIFNWELYSSSFYILIHLLYGF